MNKEIFLNKDFSTKLQKSWIAVSLGFFFLAAVLGLLMRISWSIDISTFLDYKHILHAHSHTALLGWGFLSISCGLICFILPHTKRLTSYTKVLKLGLIAGIGMFLSFLYQGYGAISITFSTIHLISAYIFAYNFLQDLKTVNDSPSKLLGRWAVYWMLISTLGLFSIAPIGILLGKNHPAYYSSIQFFLHFQFNGWFTFALLSLIYNFFAKRGISLFLGNKVFALLQLSLVLTYSLSITWSTPQSFLFYLNSLGVSLQLLTLGLISYQLLQNLMIQNTFKRIVKWLLILGLLSLILKVCIQFAVVIPFIAKISYTIRNLVIGFIHLIMLGSISLTLIGIFIHHEIMVNNKIAKWGYAFLVFGFISSEILLFGQGLLLWAEKGFISNYYLIMIILSSFLPLAIMILWISQIKYVYQNDFTKYSSYGNNKSYS